MRKLLLLFSHKLTEKQLIDVKETLKCDEIIYLPENLKERWQNMDIEENLDEFKKFLENLTSEGDYVLVQGEWGATYQIINYCKAKKLIPIYSSTKREVEERKEGESIIKLSKFKHRGFVKY